MNMIIFLPTILSLCILASSQGIDPPYIKEATTFNSSEERLYDYIIVGGGTAGCPLAATLSQNFKVLVLERGGSPYGNINISRLENFRDNLVNSSPQSPAQPFVSTDWVLNFRARVLGGGTCINAGYYSRASTSYIIRAGWNLELTRRSYEWVEEKIVHTPPLRPWQRAFREGLVDAGVLPFNGVSYEDLYGTKEGGSTFDNNGNRSTAADLLLYGNQANLRVLIRATVQRIIFNTTTRAKPRAIGVIFNDMNGVQHQAILSNTRGDIILSAGALGSPQLLILSGIGSTSELQRLQIPSLLNNQNVGRDMGDNPSTGIFIPVTRKPIEKSVVQVDGNSILGFYLESASGFCRSSRTVTCNQLPNETFNGASLVVKVKGPLSTGFLRLNTSNVNDTPIVTFNYYSNQVDLNRCVYGMRTVQSVARTGPIRDYYSSDYNIMPNTSDTLSLRRFCNETKQTLWHFHGGSLVRKVVDSDYRVIGVDGLRVVDSSTFFETPGSNPQATIMMLGRMTGVKILRERI